MRIYNAALEVCYKSIVSCFCVCSAISFFSLELLIIAPEDVPWMCHGCSWLEVSSQ